MKLSLVRIIAAGLMIAAPSLLQAGPTAADQYAESKAQGEKLIRSEIAPKVPGLTVAVFIQGQPVWDEAFGYADLRTKSPALATTRFRIGSVSKTISSVALAQLVQADRIEMDEPIQHYIPDYPNRTPITVRQLAGHLSGIRNYEDAEILSDVAYPNLHAGLRIFAADPLLSSPGAAYSYSSYNWNAIGAIIEAVTQQDFPGYVDAQILQPLGMTHTRVDRPRAPDESRASFYDLGPHGVFVNAPEIDSSYKWPSGGFLSTSIDLARFGSALLQPGFLNQNSLSLLFTPQKTSSGKPIHYGVGWFIGQNLIFHGGDIIGGSAALILLPRSQMVIALACNRGSYLYNSQASGNARLHRAPDQWSSHVLVRTGLQIAKLFHAIPRNTPMPADAPQP